MTVTSSTDQYWSRLYDTGRDFTLITPEALTKILSFIEENLPKTCLDIGCGTGQLTRELYHRGYKCVGVDASASAVKIARSLTTIPVKQLHYMHFDIEKEDIANLPQKSYSLITCKLVYAFIKDKPVFLENVKRVLAPGGIFVVITPVEADVPANRRSIAVNDEERALLSSHFNQLALYKDSNLAGALTYFVGA